MVNIIISHTNHAKLQNISIVFCHGSGVAAATPNCDCMLSAIPLQKDQGPPTSKHSPDVGAQL